MVGHHSDCIAMNECTSCQEGRIVSPAKILANKLCCPNQIQLEHPPPRTITERLVHRWWTKPISSLTGHILKDRPDGGTSISGYVEKHDASIVFTLRAPNQVVDSIIRRGGESEEKAISRWRHGIEEIGKAFTRYEKVSHIIEFSKMIKKTEKEIKKLCNFVGLEYDKNMISGTSSPQYEKEKVDESVLYREQKDYKIEEREEECYKIYNKLLEN